MQVYLFLNMYLKVFSLLGKIIICCPLVVPLIKKNETQAVADLNFQWETFERSFVVVLASSAWAQGYARNTEHVCTELKKPCNVCCRQRPKILPLVWNVP